MSELTNICRNRWYEILTHIGVSPAFLTGRHSACPFCGGKDRFRFTNRHGMGYWVCNQCGSGDGYEFVMRFKGVEFGQAVKFVSEVVGKIEMHPEAYRQIEEKKARLEEARQMWRNSFSITKDCPAGLYLTRRTGITEYPCSLRFIPDLVYREEGKVVGGYPAMIAFVSGQDGRMVNLHRTYLDSNGNKADIKNPRKSLRGSLPAGSAIRLGPIKDGKLVVAEGLETAISASQIFGAAAYSLISADRMKAWVPPSGVRHVIIAGDNDVSYTGQAAAYALANKLVVQHKIEKVEVWIPRKVGTDWNDYGMNLV